VTSVEDDLVSAGYRERLTTQSYRPGARIAGVALVDLATFSDEGGDFCEIVRLSPAGTLLALPDFLPRQINYSLMEPGAIKGWHLHRRQDDVWFVPPADRLLVGLLDTRAGSPTCDRTRRLVMGAGKARLLFIPRGVAHGVANLSSRPAGILYLTNALFDPEDPDEHRLPYDLLGAEFWTIQPG